MISLSPPTICNSAGKAGKAGPHAAYIAREGQYANRLERGEKLEATEAGNMPAWAQSNPLAFWQAADAYERKNGTTYREMEIALPRELSAAQRIELVREFVRQEIGDRHAYQWALHVPTAADGGEQPHFHLMFSERQVDGIDRDPEQYFKRYNAKAPEKGGARKGYGPSAGQTLTKAERAAELKELRGRWEAMCNAHLERAGVEQRIDMRSHAERGT
ncbi:MobA/MobL family protein, partial [Escherichia coli]|nr:MobA/MobL family protein [Escherichia coli]